MPLFDNQVIYIVDFENKSTSAKCPFFSKHDQFQTEHIVAWSRAPCNLNYYIVPGPICIKNLTFEVQTCA